FEGASRRHAVADDDEPLLRVCCHLRVCPPGSDAQVTGSEFREEPDAMSAALPNTRRWAKRWNRTVVGPAQERARSAPIYPDRVEKSGRKLPVGSARQASVALKGGK